MPVKNEMASWKKAYNWIKEEIDSCRLEMGAPLPEIRLAEEIGVSRTPVREALRALEQDGYVTILPLKGASVSQISIEDVREIYDIRKLLEPFAALSAATRIPAHEIDAMEAAWGRLDDMAKKNAPVDIADVAELDLKLHFTITKYAANKRVSAILRSYHVQIKRFQRLSAQSHADVQNSIEQHLVIINCLKERNPKALRACLYEHVAESENNVLKGYFLA